MISGNPDLFAIESQITCAYERRGFLALGFFVIHVRGRSYGVRDSNATMLANSFDAVRTRILKRGHHRALFAVDADAGEIADAVSRALFADLEMDEEILGMPADRFKDLIHSKGLLWAPDGDEAFDDGSIVLQFDVGDQVRLIAFSRASSGLCDGRSLREIWLASNVFYSILQDWQGDFEGEWKLLPKASEHIPTT